MKATPEHNETYNEKTGWIECSLCGKIIYRGKKDEQGITTRKNP